jgi:polyisoprenoid-binding protein YceI
MNTKKILWHISWNIKDMKTLLIIVFTVSTLALSGNLEQHKYSSSTGFISFFAKAPVANVDAQNKKVKVELNTSDGELSFDMAMKDFEFKNKKMGRDAEKKYLETKKYPKASFKGKIEGKVKYDKPGSYPVTAKGKLKIHGVEKTVSEKGIVVVMDDDVVKLQSEFSVMLADYKIETPKILGKEMTADKVLVKIDVKLLKDTRAIASKK